MRPSVVLTFALLLPGCGTPTPAPTPASVQRPTPIPPTAIDGDELLVHLQTPSPHVRFFNFWATWCQPCLVELPALKAFAQAHPSAEVVLVNVDHSSVQDTRAMAAIRNHGLDTLSNLLLASDDPNATLKQTIKGWPEQIPVTMVVRPDGTLAQTFIQAVSSEDLGQALKLAAAPPPSGG